MENEEEVAYRIFNEDEEEIIVPDICVDANGKEFVWEMVFDGKIKYYKDIEKILSFIRQNSNKIPYISIRKMYFQHSIRFVINRKKIKKEYTEDDFKY